MSLLKGVFKSQKQKGFGDVEKTSKTEKEKSRKKTEFELTPNIPQITRHINVMKHDIRKQIPATRMRS